MGKGWEEDGRLGEERGECTRLFSVFLWLYCSRPVPPRAPTERVPAIQEHPPFGWSWRRHSFYAECPRKYWWAVYGCWRGWAAGAGEPAWLAYRLRHLTTFPLVVGILVHEAMRRIAEAIRARGPRPSPEALYRAARDELVRVRWVERRQFLAAPRRNPMLVQCLQGNLPEAEITDALHRADALLLRCVETSSELSFWEELERAVKILPPDKVQCIEVPILGDEPFRMWGAPDLAWIHADRTSVSVDDFKTGRRLDAVRGSLQIHAYAAWMVLGGCPLVLRLAGAPDQPEGRLGGGGAHHPAGAR